MATCLPLCKLNIQTTTQLLLIRNNGTNVYSFIHPESSYVNIHAGKGSFKRLVESDKDH